MGNCVPLFLILLVYLRSNLTILLCIKLFIFTLKVIVFILQQLQSFSCLSWKITIGILNAGSCMKRLSDRAVHSNPCLSFDWAWETAWTKLVVHMALYLWVILTLSWFARCSVGCKNHNFSWCNILCSIQLEEIFLLILTLGKDKIHGLYGLSQKQQAMKIPAARK